MAKIIAFVNQKGGVGKTTSSINLAASLGLLGKKTMLVDLDPQGNSSTGVGVNKGELESSVYELLVDRAEVKKVVAKTKFKNLYIIPASINLAGVDMELMEMARNNPEFVPQLQLKKYLGEIKDVFDYIILDCPPSLGLITTNALAASDSVIIPVQCEFFALEGVQQLTDTISVVKEKWNPRLDILGVLLTMYERRYNVTRAVDDDVRAAFGDKVFKTVVPRNVRVSEAPSHGMPALFYDFNSTGAQAYLRVATEVVQRTTGE
jgi:chromosome partitioning protein